LSLCHDWVSNVYFRHLPSGLRISFTLNVTEVNAISANKWVRCGNETWGKGSFPTMWSRLHVLPHAWKAIEIQSFGEISIVTKLKILQPSFTILWLDITYNIQPPETELSLICINCPFKGRGDVIDCGVKCIDAYCAQR
jgi:hypothetical protein